MHKTTKYLFLDSGIINGHYCENSQLHVQAIQKDQVHNPLFKEGFFADNPKEWEVRYDNAYPNVFFDPFENIYRCYYTLFLKDDDSSQTPLEERPGKQYKPSSTRVTGFCYAYSEDGINWVKPTLGLVEFKGSKENNIIFRNAHGSCVYLDKEEIDTDKRYKLLTKIDYSHENSYMAIAYSSDGVHFTDPIPWPKFNPQADTYNYFFRDPVTKRFVLITRIWKNGLRIPAKSESEDFIHWSEPTEITRGHGFDSQIYSMPIFRYENIYLGLPSMYKEGDRLDENFDTVDVKLNFSVDMDHWEYVTQNESFIPRGEGKYPTGEFDCGCIFASVPVEIDDKLYFYYMGGNGQHTNYRETSFARGFIEKDKFAYYSQKNPDCQSIIYTAGFSFFGNELTLLADLEEGGCIRYEIVNRATLKAVEGFSANECEPITLSGWQDIKFKEKEITDVGNGTYSLRFIFEKAKLYALDGFLNVIKRKYN
ncbi:hypothetical protein BABA_15302 [Neobacillus bataviensis LMG 21833]|uniref:Glycosyl hydrolase family 32 N-terminal domain-containing protein n=1 Tax=Neobacillus bataviensis LMG 21833 TaxID=1117379 RepID=K6DEL3_9BACI|nr:hypothetical protein [Neobacillus bataviensis]EKN66488.1 hypothetical protein BABA_15302 [Neobacillus bataviensis LMG 21833]